MKPDLACKMLAAVLLVALTSCGGGGGGSSSSSDVAGVDLQASAEEITWYSTAQPLIQRYCVACHTEGSDLAPFPLDTYQQVYAKRSALDFVLQSGTMPPLGYAGPTASETALLLQWLANGAPEGDPSQAPLKQLTDGFTYHKDTRAIIEKRCVTCHVAGGVAPFPLDGYNKVKAVAAAALFSVENGSMPPWPPTRGYTLLLHERALTGEEKFKLRNWLAGDLAEGNPADYVPPQKLVAEKIDYNLQLPIPEPYTPTLRPDDHRCFAMEWPLDEVAYVKSVTVLPDQIQEVHHVIVNIVDPDERQAYENAGGEDGRPGWHCLGSGGIKGAPLPRQIGGWVPGVGNGAVREGTGLGIQPGSLLVVQFHYNTLVAEPRPDQSTILIATQDTVERPASGFLFTNPAFLGGGVMKIPAGNPDVHHQFTVPATFLAQIFGAPAGLKSGDTFALHNGFLHMHNLGKTGRTTLIRQDGTEQVILDIRDWDFNWQSSYGLEKELLVQPGDRLRLQCSWDNSASNQTIVNGEQLPPRDVDWGDGTGDEMCLTNFYITKPKVGYDYSYSASVHIDVPEYRQRFAAGDLVPLELLFNNFTLHEPGEHTDVHDGDHSGIYQGHYHIYLDSDDDMAEHVTAWDAKYFFQLPEDILPGTHTLRVSLRGSDHHALGIEQSVTIEVEDSSLVESLSLIDVNDWTMQSAAQDGLSAHRPANVSCPDNSWYNEDGALEVETGYCNYLSLAQPAKTAIETGDTLHLVLWHGALVFEKPTQAHVAITVDGHRVWQQNVNIPAAADIFDVRIPTDFSAPTGSKVEFHLHNHGYNSWTLLQLEVER